MFDTYMDAHALDPQMRRRMTVAMGAALVASAVAIAGYTGVEKLSITRVGAPQVELDFLMATTVASPLAAPPPPSPPAVAPAVAAAADADPDPEPPSEPDAPPLEDPLAKPRATSATPGPQGRTGVPGPPGLPPGIGPGGPPCIGGACTIGTPTAIPPRTTPPVETAKVPLDVAQGRLRFSPDPPRDALLATRAGTLGRGGTSVVEFCVGADGKVDKVSTKRSAGDGDVDRICRDTLRRWRFSPLQVQGRATRMCSEVAFVIAFE